MLFVVGSLMTLACGFVAWTTHEDRVRTVFSKRKDSLARPRSSAGLSPPTA